MGSGLGAWGETFSGPFSSRTVMSGASLGASALLDFVEHRLEFTRACHSEFAADDKQRFDFIERSPSVGERIQILPESIAPIALGDVRRNGNGRSSQLRCQSVPLGYRKTRGLQVRVDDEVDPSLQTSSDLKLQ